MLKINVFLLLCRLLTQCTAIEDYSVTKSSTSGKCKIPGTCKIHVVTTKHRIGKKYKLRKCEMQTSQMLVQGKLKVVRYVGGGGGVGTCNICVQAK